MREKSDGRVYHIASGQKVRIEEIVANLNEILGTDLPPILAGPCSTIPPLPLPDVGRAQRELGFSAAVGIGEGLRRYATLRRGEAAIGEMKIPTPHVLSSAPRGAVAGD